MHWGSPHHPPINPQGAASPEFVRALKDILISRKIDILGLLEPKVSGKHAGDIWKKIGFFNWSRVESLGFGGGLWIFWNTTQSINSIHPHPQFVLVKIRQANAPSWFCSIIYATPTPVLRKRLWQDLDHELLHIHGPWVTIGDFNTIFSDYESTSTRKNQHHTKDWIFHHQGLIDLGYTGSQYTWQRPFASLIPPGQDSPSPKKQF